MIQVHNLKKKFDDFQALNGVEMHVGKGDIYGLVGPTGISSRGWLISRMNCFILCRQIRWR